MDHTYLRYECADAFGLINTSASSKAPWSNSILAFVSKSRSKPVFLTTAGSHIIGFHLKTTRPTIKIAHREELRGGGGTGRALNSNLVVCLDVGHDDSSSTCLVASGWVDGTARIFRILPDELNAEGGCGLIQTLLQEKVREDNFVLREPLVLNGHGASAIRSISFDPVNYGRMATGSSDGVLCVWDVIDETGLFRLLGHSGAITDIHFVSAKDASFDCLITASLDGFVKVWDLKGQCCTQTLTLHRGEVWTAACKLGIPNLPHHGIEDAEERRARLVTGGSDGVARVWAIKTPKRYCALPPQTRNQNGELVAVVEDSGDEGTDDCCIYMGPIVPPPSVPFSGECIACIQFHPNGRYIGILHSNSTIVHVYIVRSVKETNRKKQRRLSRRREKAKNNVQKNEAESPLKGAKRGILDDPVAEGESVQSPPVDQANDLDGVVASDEFEFYGIANATQKVRGFSFVPWKENGSPLKIICSLGTNSVETISISGEKDRSTKDYTAASSRLSTISMPGHPTGIRAIELSSDDVLACTISKNVTKIWNVANRSCIQSLSPVVRNQSCYGLCAVFLPGNSHVLLGTREGHLVLLDVASGGVAYIEDSAHDGAIWSIDLRRPTQLQPGVAVVTGSADKTVKFWEIESSEDSTPSLTLARTLEMSDDVVAVRFSHSTDPTKRMVFVSSLDSTIKVFFEDTLKFFLSLYGHKLPALALDASDDDALLATSGADKTIKIWGLDFGDTHRTLHGHHDSITGLRFVRRTHNFFTSSKDGTVRFWDGDRFEQIMVLNGHFAEVGCLAISRTGAFVLSGGMDRQVRVWERTKDIVFVEEERERSLEHTFDQIDGRNENDTAKILENNNLEEAENYDRPESESAVKRSILSISAGDRILEAIERADQELRSITIFRKTNDGKVRQPNPLLLGKAPEAYMFWVLKSIRAAELEQSLLVLPLGHVERLVYYLVVLLKNGHGVELCSRVGVFLVKTHQMQILANSFSLAPPLRELRRLVMLRLVESRDSVGFNLAALRTVGMQASHKKDPLFTSMQPKTDVWGNLGLGNRIASVTKPKK